MKDKLEKAIIIDVPLDDKGKSKVYKVPVVFLNEKTQAVIIKGLTINLGRSQRRRLWELLTNFKNLKGKSFKEKIFALLSLPLDLFVINHYFNLLKLCTKEIVELCDLELKKEKFQKKLEKLKRNVAFAKFLDEKICQLFEMKNFSYYRELIKRIDEFIFLEYCNLPEAKEIVKNLREVLI